MVLLLAPRTNPFPFPPLATAERVATGVVVDNPVTAKSAEVVALPPIAKSNVPLIGERRLLFNCQKFCIAPPGHAPQTGLPVAAPDDNKHCCVREVVVARAS